MNKNKAIMHINKKLSFMLMQASEKWYSHPQSPPLGAWRQYIFVAKSPLDVYNWLGTSHMSVLAE